MENDKLIEEKTLHSGFVAIIGRPSAGKSTFLNTACQEEVSIVSPIPQTTRNAIKGIVNTSYGQLVFIDTPGYHDSEKKLIEIYRSQKKYSQALKIADKMLLEYGNQAEKDGVSSLKRELQALNSGADKEIFEKANIDQNEMNQRKNYQ